MPAPTTVLLYGGIAFAEVERVAPPDRRWTSVISFNGGGVAFVSDLNFVDRSRGALVFGAAETDLQFLGPTGLGPPTTVRTSPLGSVYLTDDGGTRWHLEHIPR